MVAVMRPTIAMLTSDSMQGFFRSVQTAVAPMLKLQAQMEQEAERWKTFSEPKEYMMPTITYAPRVVRLDDDQFDELVGKIAAMTSPQKTEISYDRRSKELYRYAFGTRLSSAFKDAEDNDRLQLIEKLTRSDKYIATRDLMEYLSYNNTKRVRNLIQAVNAKIGSDLRLTQPFIKGARGSGYRIDALYSVLTVQ